jgi:SHS2 domain-containing protein
MSTVAPSRLGFRESAERAFEIDRGDVSRLLELAQLGDLIAELLESAEGLTEATEIVSSALAEVEVAELVPLDQAVEKLAEQLSRDIAFSATGRVVFLDLIVSTGATVSAAMDSRRLRPEGAVLVALAATSPTETVSNVRMLLPAL